MPKFSQLSRSRLDTCDARLRVLFEEVVKGYDCTILCGWRGKEEQDKAVAEGKSKTQFPDSKHNITPSRAVDVAPYPVDWNDSKRFYHFAGYVKAIAERLGIDIRWGGDWNGDLDFKDQNFNDLPHFELK